MIHDLILRIDLQLQLIYAQLVRSSFGNVLANPSCKIYYWKYSVKRLIHIVVVSAYRFISFKRLRIPQCVAWKYTIGFKNLFLYYWFSLPKLPPRSKASIMNATLAGILHVSQFLINNTLNFKTIFFCSFLKLAWVEITASRFLTAYKFLLEPLQLCSKDRCANTSNKTFSRWNRSIFPTTETSSVAELYTLQPIQTPFLIQ